MPSPAAESDVLRHLSRLLAAELELPGPAAVDPDAAFSDIGLDSAGVHAIAGQLADLTGRPVPPELLFEHPTARLLAGHLAAGTPAT